MGFTFPSIVGTHTSGEPRNGEHRDFIVDGPEITGNYWTYDQRMTGRRDGVSRKRKDKRKLNAVECTRFNLQEVSDLSGPHKVGKPMNRTRYVHRKRVLNA